MAQSYKIAAVSPKQDHWSGQYGDMVTYYIRLEGEGDEAVAINKKPDSPAPQDGDELYGDITSTSHGLKFKTQKKPFAQEGGYQKSPEVEESIARAVSLKAAVEYVASTSSSGDDVIPLAETYLEWLRGGKPATEPQNSSQDNLKAKVDDVFPTDDKPINLDDIPF